MQTLEERPPALHLGISYLPNKRFPEPLVHCPIISMTVSEAPDRSALIASLSPELVEDERYIPEIMEFLVVGGIVHSAIESVVSHAASMSSLRSLELHNPSAGGGVLMPDGVENLYSLHRLVLSGYFSYNFTCLPRSLKHLELSYQQVWERSYYHSHTIDIPVLPEGARLDHLSVSKQGIVGLPFEDLWDKVKEIKVKAMFLLAGVPVQGKSFP